MKLGPDVGSFHSVKLGCLGPGGELALGGLQERKEGHREAGADLARASVVTSSHLCISHLILTSWWSMQQP